MVVVVGGEGGGGGPVTPRTPPGSGHALFLGSPEDMRKAYREPGLCGCCGGGGGRGARRN